MVTIFHLVDIALIKRYYRNFSLWENNYTMLGGEFE